MRTRAALLGSIATLSVVALLSGCGSQTGTKPAANADATDNETIAPLFDASGDTTGIDVAPAQDIGANQVAETAGDAAADGKDADNPLCPGGTGCPCKEAADCDAGLCLETPEGLRCATTCTDICTVGFRCVTLSTGSDAVNACVNKWSRLCSPCTTNEQCGVPGIFDAHCIDRGDAGSFCGSYCDENADCPEGYACKKALDVDGQQASQCVAVDTEGELAACSCTPMAVSLGIVGVCKNAVVGPEGELTCSGTLQCLDAAQPASCKAASPEAESCNGQDDDCDGATDEALCDDGNACTKDACDPVAGTCSHQALAEGVACDADGDACTVGDACAAGVCKPGMAKDCDDGNPCTIGSCNLAGSCTQTADDGAPCTDDNACTIGDVCAGATCTAGALKACAPGAPCTIGQCSPIDGKCKYGESADGVPCDDGNPCTEAEACEKGLCKGSAANCDDGNPCTVESCTAGSGCTSKANDAASCDDGDACTAGDGCSGGGCKAGAKVECDDGNPCTADGCDTKKGCTAVALPGATTPCYAGPAATAGVGLCKAGQRTCGQDAVLGPCVGSVLPADKEGCNGQDDDCDGQTDEGCEPGGIAISQAPLRLRSKGTKVAIDAAMQTTTDGSSKAGKHTLRWSLVDLWRGWFGGK